MKEILRQLCADKGVSGEEREMLGIVQELAGDMAEIKRQQPFDDFGLKVGL